MPNFLSPRKNKTDKPNSILGHNPRLPCINATDIQNITHLGQGSQGLVTKVHTKMIGTCAMKKFRAKQSVQYFGQGEFVNESVDRENQERTVDLVREIKYCSQVDNHPNIVSFYAYVTEYGKDDANNTIPKVHRGILMEYMPGGSLDYYNQLLHDVFNPDRVQKWALQIARALAFCHCVHNVIHRDVKPSNILLSQDYETAKLSDFGIARENKGDKSVGKGTPQFQAPETFDHHDYDTKADVYSYGCLLYAMTTQRRPFDEKSRENQFVFYNYLKDDNNRPPLSDEPLFKQLNEIINKCWKFDPKDRPTMHDIVCKLDKSS